MYMLSLEFRFYVFPNWLYTGMLLLPTLLIKDVKGFDTYVRIVTIRKHKY